MSAAEGVTRRSALTATGVAAVGGVAGFVLARNSDAATSKKGTTAANAYGDTPAGGGQRLAAVADIPDGGGKVLDDPAVVLTRRGTEVHAFSAVCTHQGCRVDKVANGVIDCPCHGSRFDAATGRVVAGPAPSPLPAVPVTVRAGEVFSA
jgi:Rieske Fe-S protein